METLQTYQTAIMDSNSGAGVGVFVVPANALSKAVTGERRVPETPAIARMLGLHVESLFPSSAIPQLLEEIIRFENSISGYEMLQQDLAAFCEYVAFARLIPFEHSPVAGESLATIASSATKAGAVGIGVTVGFISGGFTPLLLITVPLGVVICGAAVSFSKWLEENRAEVWRTLLGFEDVEPLNRREHAAARLAKRSRPDSEDVRE
jgi:hypothetical protein